MRVLMLTLFSVVFALMPMTASAGDPDSSPAPVEKTGQTTSSATGDDGDLRKGVAWPTPRFTDNGDGTVTDNLTGLMWTQNADHDSTTWNAALTYCNNLTSGGYSDWRLPNVKELQSLTDFSQYHPALPAGHPFSGVQSGNYWSSTVHAAATGNAWYISIFGGDVYGGNKSFSFFIWPVRGGQ